MTDLLITNTQLNGTPVDIAVKDTRIQAITPAGTLSRDTARDIIDGTDTFVRPPFYNTHTHHAMTLLRGIDDDCALMDWLTRCIWPREARLTQDAVYAGTRLAILEGIRTGCVAFNDMYFHQPAAIRAAIDMGVRAQIGLLYMNQVSDHIENEATLEMRPDLPDSIRLALSPHAIYTTTPDILKDIARKADNLGLPIHTHIAETPMENEIARSQFDSESAVAYLNRCGLLRDGTILAHCCHVSDADLALMAEHNCLVATCPCSNQKLASGTFPLAKALTAGVRVTVGTDGAASNNSLSMISETKAAALSGKLNAGRPDAFSLRDLDRGVTETAAAALGFPNAGRIAESADADLILVNLNAPAFATGDTPDANFIYAADSAAVHTVLCNGHILMRHGIIPNENDILAAAREAATRLRPTA